MKEEKMNKPSRDIKKKITRNRRPLYNEGYRGEIMRELLEYGGVIYKSFHLHEGQYAMYVRKIKDMQEEKIVQIIRQGSKDIAVLKDFGRNYERYIEDFPMGTFKIYNYEAVRRRRNLVNGSIAEKLRAYKELSTLSFMRHSGILTNPLEKTNIRINGSVIGEDEVNFYSTKEMVNMYCEEEIKWDEEMFIQEEEENMETSEDLAESQNEDGTHAPQKKNTGNTSRSMGSIICPGSVYAVYNVGNSMMEWKKANEMATKGKISMMASQCSEKYRQKNGKYVNGIVLYNDDNILERIVVYQKSNSSVYRDKKTKVERKTYFHIDFTYEKMYGLPLTEDGMKMMNIMTRENWEHNMDSYFLKKEEISKARYSSIVCDGYDGEHYILLYCKPDLVKLKQFVQRANLEETPEKFRVYCFDWQVPLIAKLTKGNVEVYKTKFSEYYNAYKGSL